jgi:dTDP-4-dehydrorhamnose reductase
MARGGGEILALAGRHDVGVGNVRVGRVDLMDLAALRDTVAAFRPTHIVHTAAMSAVGECHARPSDATRVNTEATVVLAKAARECGARMAFTSTDMVFAGDAAPYREADPPRPLSHYGQTKLAAEQGLADAPHVAAVRLPLMYGLSCSGRDTTFAKQLAALRTGEPLRLFVDEFRTPVWLVDAARALVAIAASDFAGVLHVSGPERLSRYALVARCAAVLGVESPKLVEASRLDIDSPEPRPEDLSLDQGRFRELFPGLEPGPVREEVFAAVW